MCPKIYPNILLNDQNNKFQLISLLQEVFPLLLILSTGSVVQPRCENT